GYLYSKPILFKNDIKIANVKVCESVPNKTSIKYYLAPIYASALADLTSGVTTADELYYYPLDLTDSDSVSIDFLNSSITPTIEGILIDDMLGYKDRAQYDYCLDQILPLDYVKDQTTILRDALDQNSHITTGKENTILGQYSGWL